MQHENSMSPEVIEQIQTLAVSLKSMHLAATMEEAMERAKVIILQSKGTNDQPLKNVLQKGEQEVRQSVEESMNGMQKIDLTLDKMRDELSQVEARQQQNVHEVKKDVKKNVNQVHEDIISHAKEQKDFEMIEGDLIKKKQALKDMKDFIEMAKEVQK